jgi:L-alanine-DL-glutamate epimerase-like enolase superfamily enzyme
LLFGGPLIFYPFRKMGTLGKIPVKYLLMQIRRIRVRRENLDLTRPYDIAYKTVTAVENCFVELELENGLTGIGAANPSKQVVGESTDDAWRTMQEPGLQWLEGRDIRAIGGLLQEIGEKFPANPGVRAALDIALHDVFTQYLGVPLAVYFGQCIESLPTSITIGIKGVAETLEEANEYVGRGFRVLKVKLGKSLEEDIERLTKLREKFGSSVIIRIDANQGYNTADLGIFCIQTAKLNVELIEQPLPAAAIAEMKALPEEIKKLVAADESLVSVQDAFRLASPPAASGIFNIKLMKCGGISPAREIASIARQAGISLMWGCNDESIVSIAAALHVALSCPNTRYLDLDGSLDLARDLVSGGFIIKDGVMSITGESGLGVKRVVSRLES